LAVDDGDETRIYQTLHFSVVGNKLTKHPTLALSSSHQQLARLKIHKS
jgi:hypothetical protein